MSYLNSVTLVDCLSGNGIKNPVPGWHCCELACAELEQNAYVSD